LLFLSNEKNTFFAQSDNNPIMPPEGRHNLENLIDLAYALSQQNQFEEILRLVAQRTAALLQAQTALIMMVNPQTRQTVKTVIREGREEQAVKYRVVQDQINGWMMKFNQPLLSQDIKTDPRFAKVKFGDLAIKSVAAALIKIEGIVLGSLMVLNKRNDEAFAEDDLTYLDKIAVIAAPYLRNVQKIQQFFSALLPEAALVSKYENVGLLGKSKKFVQLLQTIEAAARCDVRVQLESRAARVRNALREPSTNSAAAATSRSSPLIAAPFRRI
jgi:transcriptional regulator with GAF, ATPase, and Fis domain